MMAHEFDQFVKLIGKLEKLYGKTLEDDLMQMYWDALKEQPLVAVERRLGDYIKRGKFFPKPSELRPREDAPVFEQSEKSRKDFEMTEKRNIEFWDSELQVSPIAAKWEILRAYEARTTAAVKPGTSEYQRRVDFARHARGKLLLESGGIQ